MTHLVRIWALALGPALLACGPTAEPAPAKTAAATAAPPLEIQVQRERFGVDAVVLAGPVLVKRLPRGGTAIAFFNAGARGADCNAVGLVPDLEVPIWQIVGPIGGDGFAFLLALEGPWNGPGGRRYTSWRLYYSKPGTGEAVHEAAGPSTSNVQLSLTPVSAERMRGSVSGTLTLSPVVGTTVKGTFEATVCPEG